LTTYRSTRAIGAFCPHSSLRTSLGRSRTSQYAPSLARPAPRLRPKRLITNPGTKAPKSSANNVVGQRARPARCHTGYALDELSMCVPHKDNYDTHRQK
jgi:hypothetical protein